MYTQILRTQAMIVSGVNFLTLIAKDSQFDPKHKEYLGFVNVSADDIYEWYHTWMYICENPHIFRPIISQLGLRLDEDVLNSYETVFYMK